jgi:hypothetical protein
MFGRKNGRIRRRGNGHAGGIATYLSGTTTKTKGRPRFRIA